MSLCRQLLESNSRVKQFPTLKFYCDWSLHSKIERSPFRIEILDKISEEINSSVTKDFHAIITKIISVQNLREELIQLFDQYSLPVILFKINENWKNFLDVFVGLLIEKPIIRRIPIPSPNQLPICVLSLRLGVLGIEPMLDRLKCSPYKPMNQLNSIWWIIETNKLDVPIIGPFIFS